MGMEIDLFDSRSESNAAGAIAQAFWSFGANGPCLLPVLRNRKGAGHKRAMATARLNGRT